MAEADQRGKRIPVYIRCSDEAYERLIRRRDGRDGLHANIHDRLNDILSEFCAELERAIDQQEGVRLLAPRADTSKVRSRRFWLEPELKGRLDRLAAAVPVSVEILCREAIFRRTNTW